MASVFNFLTLSFTEKKVLILKVQHIYIYVCIWYVCVYVCVHMHVYVCVCVCVCVCVYGTHFSVLACEIPRAVVPGGLQSMELQKSQTQLSDQTTKYTHTYV